MTARTDAIAYVTLWADTATFPALTAGEVGSLVDQCALVDADGVAPPDTGWVATYWTDRAVQRALELRAARAAAITDTSTDGTSISGSQLEVALTRHALRWARKCAGGPQ